jgi:hypothetical protein
MRRTASSRRRPGPDEAGANLIISHGAYLSRDDFTRHIHAETGITDGMDRLERRDHRPCQRTPAILRRGEAHPAK